MGKADEVHISSAARLGRKNRDPLCPGWGTTRPARDQVPIASNLVLDRSGKIRFFSLLDTANFDAKLLALTVRLDALLTEK